MTHLLPPVHPGEILREEYLLSLNISAAALATKLNLPSTCIEGIAAEQAPITTDIALCLAKYFRTTPEFWMNMQASFNLKTEEKSTRPLD
ncbi:MULTISPECIES: HigA family addiction module antitoxin [unclassified Ensifer]|uniref:HigA family addiction module antitoxin n=1 Tax=unclassified Ensifer TaxID=2633371 RepID=UPI0030104F2E